MYQVIIKSHLCPLAYSLDGITAGVTTVLAGYLVVCFEKNKIIFFGKLLGSYEVLFVICAIITLISMNTFILIREKGAMGVRTFLRQLIYYRKQIP